MVQTKLNVMVEMKQLKNFWLIIEDENGNFNDVFCNKFLIDKTDKKVIIEGHNGVWKINTEQIHRMY